MILEFTRGLLLTRRKQTLVFDLSATKSSVPTVHRHQADYVSEVLWSLIRAKATRQLMRMGWRIGEPAMRLRHLWDL